jgi:dihydrofolate synthase/folylpolyglutamate synthase
MMTYRQALDYVYSFTNFEVTPAGSYTSKTFDLTRIERLLAALDNPHRKFQSFHVAGTKGKGSTAAMIESILRSAHHRTGLYTSPHLHTFRERIRVDGEMISEVEVAAGIERIRPVADSLPQVTTFEIMTALAFDYFAVRGVEFAVLEVGLGGRLDATNVVLPRVSVITSISYDHTAILGKTLTEIGREKAGIIKPGVPTVTSPQDPEALAVIRESARERNAPLVEVDPHLRFAIGDIQYHIVPVSESIDGHTFKLERTPIHQSPITNHQSLKLPLAGRHQLANAATALAAIALLKQQGTAIPDDALRQGLAKVQWPGRFEILQRAPLLIVDGAHNADSARQLIQTLHDFRADAALHLIFGASNDKDIAGMFDQLLPHAGSLILTRSHNPRASDPVKLAALAEKYNVETSIAPDLAAALEEAWRRARPGDIICVTGSLFVVAEARQVWLERHGQSVERDG